MSERLRRVVAATTLAGLGLFATACASQEKSSASDIRGGCASFQVYSQNRWKPYGTAVRSRPSLQAPLLATVEGNHTIEVDGWVDTDVDVYPHNSEPWNSPDWFHVTDKVDGQDGWVSFAGVRGGTTTKDPTGLLSGGVPAPVQPACEATYVR